VYSGTVNMPPEIAKSTIPAVAQMPRASARK
jgi:hypothetical protein